MLTKPRPPAPSRPVRVLVFDRTVAAVRALRSMLQRSGDFRVHSARTLDEAAALLGDGTFDAALVDDGLWERASETFLDAARRCPELCVLLVTEHPPAIRLALPRGVQGALERRCLADPADAAGRILAALGEHRTGRRKETMARWLEREASTDHLTGLYNRHAFDDRLAETVAASRTDGTPVTVVTLDVVGTRMVNEAHGHDVGDAMIRRAAMGISRAIRGGDFAARVGGDDFAIILARADLNLGRLVARRIAHEIERMNGAEWDGEIPVTVTFGVATSVGAAPGELFAAAEQQLRSGPARPPLMLLRLRGEPEGPSVA